MQKKISISNRFVSKVIVAKMRPRANRIRSHVLRTMTKHRKTEAHDTSF